MTRLVLDEFITDEALERLHDEWLHGRTKNDIERTEWNDPYSHGKRFTRLVRDRLGIETEDMHPLAIENNRLRQLLEANGIDPDG